MHREHILQININKNWHEMQTKIFTKSRIGYVANNKIRGKNQLNRILS